MARTDLVEHAMDLEHANVSCGCVAIQVWAGACTIAAAKGIDRTIDALVQRHPDGVAILGLSRPGVSVVPAADVRHELADMFRRHVKHVRCIATVIAGEGFIAATKRSVIAAIGMLARQPGPLKIFEDNRSATAWVAEQLHGAAGAPGSGAELEEQLRAIELRYDEFLARARRPVPAH